VNTPTGCDLRNWVNLGNGRLIAVGGGAETGGGCQQHGDIQISTDFGNTWVGKDIRSATHQKSLNSATWNQRANVWLALGSGGFIIRSTDRGQNWTTNTNLPNGLAKVTCSR
jgi:photosystem II stability/assembly factor-like uncharacterized protein